MCADSLDFKADVLLDIGWAELVRPISTNSTQIFTQLNGVHDSQKWTLNTKVAKSGYREVGIYTTLLCAPQLLLCLCCHPTYNSSAFLLYSSPRYRQCRHGCPRHFAVFLQDRVGSGEDIFAKFTYNSHVRR